MPEILSVGGLTADQRRLCMRTLNYTLITCAICTEVVVTPDIRAILNVKSTLHAGKNLMRQGKTHLQPQPITGCLGLFLLIIGCLLYTSPSPRDATLSRMPSSA